ncbi:sugar phosphate isomerase/epimerase family protein [Paraglaciecola hydrolytica]|uniref:sugar phosphate isomerase/epimerase family protein n=1 Tax=Paraglaciecola hydrolytica TaxID=1799789 RepID=UPI0008393732|nr:sugar phosphate isomerase/epimerase family protein [Paraglaciecola hydrolytica]
MKTLSLLSLTAITLALLVSCSPVEQNAKPETTETTKIIPVAKYSLAQWSFNRDLFAGEMNTVDFIHAAGDMGFEGVEYVSQFFKDKADDFAYLDTLNAAAKQAGVRNVMLQVDNMGNLGASDPAERAQAIADGKTWVDAASYLDCDTMRVNAHGEGDAEQVKAFSIESIAELAQYANSKGVQIIIENHGGISNNGAWLADLVAQLADHNVASLVDFHNWCVERENGQLWGAPCIKEYDYYQGFAELIPSAQGVSVKAFEFDAQGNETTMDIVRFFQLMKDANYDGYLGIEYEGDTLPSRDGILKTKALAEKSWQAVNQE